MNWLPRRPSAPDTTSSPDPPPRVRTTSGSMRFASVLGLGPKAKSRERLRTGTNSAPIISPRSVGSTPPSLITHRTNSSRIPSSSNRQTVVSTGSSDIWPEPTTPSSASDTKQSFQSMGPGLGAVGDDPFAREPVYVTSERKKEKEKERPPERARKLGVSAGSPEPSLRAFPSPPESGIPRRTASEFVPSSRPAPTQRAHSAGGPPLITEPGPSRQQTLPSPSSPRLSPSSHLSPVTPTHLSPVSPHSGSHLSPHLSPTSLPHLSQYPSSSHMSRKSSSSRLSPQSSTSHLSPKSSTSRLSPKSSFSHLSRSTSDSSSHNLGSPSSSTTPTTFSGSTVPTTASPSSFIGSVSALDMHAHASAIQSYAYSPDSSPIEGYAGKTLREMRSAERLGLERGILEDDVLDPDMTPTLSMRRGQSAHAVLSRPREGPQLSPRESIPHLSTRESNPNLGIGRAGMGISALSNGGVGMGSMMALASGIVREVSGDAPGVGVGSGSEERIGAQSPVSARKPPPKRPSRSELRERASSSSLANHIVPPPRGSSLQPSPNGSRRGSENEGAGSGFGSTLSVPPINELEALTVLPGSPRGSAGTSDASTSAGTPVPPSTGSTPNASAVSTPTPGASSSSAPFSSPRPRTRDVTPTASSPSKHPARLAVPRSQSPPPPSSSELANLDNFTFAPISHDTENASINLTELGLDLGDEESVWSEDDTRLGVIFYHDESKSKYARRPPPSPTTLPFMAGNVRRRAKGRDMVYPSGVHMIPTAAVSDLARMGKEEDAAKHAVVGIPVMELEEEQADAEDDPAAEDEQAPTPPASAPPSSPSPVNPLTRISSMSSRTSSCSSVGPEMVPQGVSSHVAFSRHTRTGSYSDSELDWDLTTNEKRIKPKATTKKTITSSIQTAVAWRCGSGNHEKCCQTRALRDGLNMGRWKCCAERAAGKNARCCAASVGRPCERPRVSSTSSASVHEAGWALKRQRSFHLSSFSGMAMASPLTSTSPQSGGLHANARRFFHRPHTSHGKSTSSALLDEETKAMLSAKGARMSREDPGPQPAPGPDDVFAIPTVASPPMSPLSRHEFKAQYIISPAKLHDHLKEARTPIVASPIPLPEPGLRSPRLEPSRQRSNTTTTSMTTTTTTTDTTGSVRSTTFSIRSTDSPAPIRSLNPPRRNHNTSLPVMPSSQAAPMPRRYVQSISTVTQPTAVTAPPPPPRSPIGAGLPPPPRGRVGTQPIVSFISPRTAPPPRPTGLPAVGLKHQSSMESCESASTVRRERPIPPRENQMSFLEFGVEEEEESEEEEEEDESNWANVDMSGRPILQHSQSFLDLSGRQSGDTMRESMAMFS